MKSLTRFELRSCIVGSTANEFIIIAFCYERAGLVAVREIIQNSTKSYAYFSYRVNYMCTGSKKCFKNAKIAEFYDLSPPIFHKIALNSELSMIMVCNCVHTL